MTYRSMLVALDATPSNTPRTNTAIALARQFEAHLIGLAPVDAVEPPALQAAAALHEHISRVGAELLAQAQDLAHRFHQRCEAVALPSFEALADRTPAPGSLIGHAQCTDLLIQSQPDPRLADHRQRLASLEEMLLGCPRPVLLLPCTHAEPLGLERILVAWDGSPQSVRAMTDALPLLRRAASVMLMHWRHPDDEGAPRERMTCLRQWLAFQGVDAEVRDEVTPMPVGEALLRAAAGLRANLVVMGAYGRARWTERLFGGVSRTLLQAMTIPVLMSH